MFSALLNPISHMCRDFQRVHKSLLTPVVEALAPIANVSIESQVLNPFLWNEACLKFCVASMGLKA